MLRRILIPTFVVIALLAIAGGVAFWLWDGYMYYRTDDAQVTGQIVNVSAPASGTLTTLSVAVGQNVSAGQTIGTITLPASSTTTSTPGGTAPATLVLTSPIDGTILQVPAVQGQTVTPGLQLVAVTNLNNLGIVDYVDEGALSAIGLNQAVDISLDAYSDTSFSGHVQQIVQATAGQFSLLPSTDNSSGNYTKVSQRIPVYVKLDAPYDGSLAPGMSVEVTIHLH